ncbi:MAG: hypothetical protein AAF591_14205 [Verrucomicrobiota bacterium]
MTPLLSRLIPITAATAAFFALSSLLAADDLKNSLRQDLERVYGRWRSSILTQNFERWRETTASYRQVITRNAILSRKQPFPASIFQLPIAPPALEGLQLLKFDIKNKTAVAVYYGPVDFNIEVDDIPNNLIILRFVYEDGEWRYDNSRYINLAGAEHIREEIANNELDFLDEEDFAPLDAVPPTGQLCPEPAFAAHLHLVSVGYRTTAQINDFYEIEVAQNGGTDIITGGLAAGDNTLKLQVERLELPPEAEKDRRFSLSIYALRREMNKAPVRVFHLAPDADPPESLEKSIPIDPQIINAQP